ncbi:MAG: GH92 family glycosyl hydrolase [Prevotella sp.]|jgi:predicted alpha-1,2-mannosidase|nr:GH92 family glycosyl hydrolase [Prevotella sp.]
MKIYRFLTISIVLSLFNTLNASSYNVAPKCRVTASSALNESYKADNIIDQVIRISEKGEWASNSIMTFWGEIDYPWIQLDWDDPVNINKVILYDRPDMKTHVAGGILHFSDGSQINVWQIPNDGSPKVIEFPAKKTEWIRFEVTDGDGVNLGLSEIEVFPAPEDYPDYVSWVDPYIESARGRYFFFITGNQPFGMIGAAPLTRNKNQYGGGYNYNSTDILGFPQIHCWMLSGLTLMPTTGKVNPTLGEQHWKSSFTHEGEIVQPGYHRLYLEDYNIWVEQTATDRTSFYRLTYTQDTLTNILFNLGGYVSTSTMVNAHAYKTESNEISGYFDTKGRLWGGPDVVRIFFVAHFDKPFDSLDGWADKEYFTNIENLQGTTESTPRQSSGWSYYDAPTSGISAKYKVKPGDQINIKMAISYVSIANAKENLKEDCNHWDFDKVRKDSQNEWNQWFGKIDVKGGTDAQKIKLYTDLWHTLLGRHKLDDFNGEYPDYTKGGVRQGTHTLNAELKVKHLKKDKLGKPIHHMYNFDALWLTQWNLNTLWGIAYPSVLDDFAASLIEYDINGGLLPRGPCAGGYSYIMTGCPATSLITSAYQKNVSRKWSPLVGYNAMKRNHAKGGMLALNMDKELDFYIENGYCPDNAGLTIQWTFEDWALAEMASKMGKEKDYSYFHKRAMGWPNSFNRDLKLILPKKEDGSWLHTNPLSGNGYIEANAWQATFGLSHDISGLTQLMGGSDSICSMLNYAFEQSASADFVYGYGGGYISYANQPGCSNAHVFAHAGKPWLTQYWVRRVKEQAHGAITPDKGYGGHDEDQGQMGGISTLMAIGLFSLDGGSNREPVYDITSPVFDEVTIKLDQAYYKGRQFKIKTYNNSKENCYIQRARLNGNEYNAYQISHTSFTEGGILELWLGNTPNKEWGVSD